MEPSRGPGAAPRATPWRVMDRVLLVLLPFTLLAALFFLPEALVALAAEKRLRKGARVERGLGGIISTDTLELLRPNQPALVIPLAGIARVHWMILPKGRKRAEDMYVARVEDKHGNAWLVEEPPQGFTRTMASHRLVSRFSYGKPLEWAALALWWWLIYWAAHTYIPWDDVAAAWREYQDPPGLRP